MMNNLSYLCTSEGTRPGIKTWTSQKEKAFVPPMDNVSPDCGYILFKDSKIVIFYSNDLDGMPSKAILDDMTRKQSGFAEDCQAFADGQVTKYLQDLLSRSVRRL
jgi:hypothetical protein